MTSDEVYKLIEANGLTLHGDIEHFAALVASAEREACANIAHQWSKREDDVGGYIEAAIRARGQA